jgi:hypothetical protein
MVSSAWPKLLGLICGCTSFGLVVSPLQDWWIFHSVTKTGLGFWFWVFWLGSFVLLVLSYPLYCARDWARRAVLVLGVCFTLAIINSFAKTAWFEYSIRASATTTQERIERFTSSISRIGMGVCILGPQLFLLCALCHRDVVAAFRQRTPATHDETI